MKRSSVVLAVFVAAVLFGAIIFASQQSAGLATNSSKSLFADGAIAGFDSSNQEPVPAGYKRYSHPVLNFSFIYPEGYTASAFNDDVGNTVLVQRSDEHGVQMFMMPFDEDITVLTEERIRQDVPDVVMKNKREIILGDSKGLYFQTESGLGIMHEVWFVYKGNLYQVTAPDASQELLQTVLTSFQILK
jgi:hypothetical protein